jgi:hypothetical protein
LKTGSANFSRCFVRISIPLRPLFARKRYGLLGPLVHGMLKMSGPGSGNNIQIAAIVCFGSISAEYFALGSASQKFRTDQSVSSHFGIRCPWIITVIDQRSENLF